jgi:hypothetical protein
MARRARSWVRVVITVVVASVVALGLLTSGVGLRPAAASQGCDTLNLLAP